MCSGSFRQPRPCHLLSSSSLQLCLEEDCESPLSDLVHLRTVPHYPFFSSEPSFFPFWLLLLWSIPFSSRAIQFHTSTTARHRPPLKSDDPPQSILDRERRLPSPGKETPPEIQVQSLNLSLLLTSLPSSFPRDLAVRRPFTSLPYLWSLIWLQRPPSSTSLRPSPKRFRPLEFPRSAEFQLDWE